MEAGVEQARAKTAFVTGGTGFIGSHLVEALLQRGYGEVRCLVRASRKWLDGMDVSIVRGDLADTKALREGVRGVDYVYHVAGVTRAPSWDVFRKGNIEATRNLMEVIREAAPGVRKVLVTSSLAAVGPCPDGVADETTPLHPISSYGRSKAEMERMLADYHAVLPVVVIRPPAVYGPREADIYTFFKAVRRGICPIVGSGREPELSLVHVRDLVRGMIDAAEAAETTGQTYFLGSEAFYSWREIRDATKKALGRPVLTIPVPGSLVGTVGAVVEMVCKMFGQYPPLNREKAREIRDACKKCSVAKAVRDFGYRQTVSLEEGIRETIAWYRDQGWL